MRYYFKLIRPVNLLIIALTQYLMLFWIIKPLLAENSCGLQMSHLDFALFVLANLLLAAAGYAINDYFDIEADSINKPGKNVLENKIPRRHAYRMNIIMNSLAGIIGFYCAYKVGYIMLGFFFVVIALALYYYSLKYKRQFLTGNIVVALMTAYAVFSVWLFQFFAIFSLAKAGDPYIYIHTIDARKEISYFILGFAVFAFLLTLLREFIKDIEDVRGDEAVGCNTLPIKKGMPAAQRWVLVLSVIIIILLAVCQALLFTTQTALSLYLVVIQAMLVYLIIKVKRARDVSEFHFLSMFAKIIIVAGLLSTQVLYSYF
ncbi:MAG TPA: geranylgeranylglycerol-phosphate geranylgeranyltransferase [Bacteroidales bacterium]|nr:geranylgeranylglycerol-phosphate geranylgeranyltransferase [Bacteroidales bacterium]